MHSKTVLFELRCNEMFSRRLTKRWMERNIVLIYDIPELENIKKGKEDIVESFAVDIREAREATEKTAGAKTGEVGK
jgi:hypothetical protein